MTTKIKSSKTRQRHSQQYKTESLNLAEKVGIPTAAKQLGREHPILMRQERPIQTGVKFYKNNMLKHKVL